MTNTNIDPHGPYVQSDLNRIHDPDIYNVSRIRNEGLILCQCCITEIDSTDHAETGMIFRYDRDTVIGIHQKIKTVYCAKCLHHIGIKTCPSIRGVPAYKTVDPVIVDRIMQL